MPQAVPATLLRIGNLPQIHRQVLERSYYVEYFFVNQIGSSQMGNTMDLREVNEKRYEIAAAQASATMLIGLFSNLAIFAITAFAEISPGAQTSWKVIVSIIEAFFLMFALGVFGDIAAVVQDIPQNEDSHWNRNARQAPPVVFMAITAIGIIALWYFQFKAIGA